MDSPSVAMNQHSVSLSESDNTLTLLALIVRFLSSSPARVNYIHTWNNHESCAGYIHVVAVNFLSDQKKKTHIQTFTHVYI